MPRISQHELHSAIDAGVLPAERGIRQVIDLGGEVDGLALAMKPLCPQFAAAGEVDLGGVARRKVPGAEQNTAYRGDVRRHRASTREVPLGNEGIDAAGVLRAMNPELIQRDEVHGHLEGAAQSILSNLMRQHPSDASSNNQTLRAGRVGEGLATPDKQTFVPSGLTQDINWIISGNLRQQRQAGKQAKESEANGNFHGSGQRQKLSGCAGRSKFSLSKTLRPGTSN